MAWEIFERSKAPSGEAAVTISLMGRISFNKTATLKLLDAKAKHIQLLWDKESRKIAIRLINAERGAFTVLFTGNYTGAGFSCVGFLNFIGYDWSITRSFPIDWDDDGMMYMFDVPQECVGKTPPRRLTQRRAKQEDVIEELADVGSAHQKKETP